MVDLRRAFLLPWFFARSTVLVHKIRSDSTQRKDRLINIIIHLLRFAEEECSIIINEVDSPTAEAIILEFDRRKETMTRYAKLQEA
jgi:hypothetical protein